VIQIVAIPPTELVDCSDPAYHTYLLASLTFISRARLAAARRAREMKVELVSPVPLLCRSGMNDPPTSVGVIHQGNLSITITPTVYWYHRRSVASTTISEFSLTLITNGKRRSLRTTAYPSSRSSTVAAA
jgi:hypothetical protein